MEKVDATLIVTVSRECFVLTQLSLEELDTFQELLLTELTLIMPMTEFVSVLTTGLKMLSEVTMLALATDPAELEKETAMMTETVMESWFAIKEPTEKKFHGLNFKIITRKTVLFALTHTPKFMLTISKTAQILTNAILEMLDVEMMMTVLDIFNALTECQETLLLTLIFLKMSEELM